MKRLKLDNVQKITQLCFSGKDPSSIFKIVYGNESISEHGDRLKVGN